MKRLEEVKKYQRPEFLRDYADLVGIVTPQIKKDLNIPDEEPLKVVFRERRLAGGLRFTIRRREEVLKKTERGGFETIEEEKEYQIEVNERGNLVSLKERAEKM
jgi:hypothetical protein